MPTTFYVIYNPATETYRNEDGGWGPYAEAEPFFNSRPDWLVENEGHYVGLCVEGETP